MPLKWRLRRRSSTPIGSSSGSNSDTDRHSTHPVETLGGEEPTLVEPKTQSRLITGYFEVREVLSDTATFTSSGDAIDCAQKRPLLPLQSEGSTHSNLRSGMESYFSPKNLGQMEATLREHANRLIDGFAAGGAVDFNHDFALRFPVLSLLEVLGLPQSDERRIREFHDGILAPRTEEERQKTSEAIYTYFDAVVRSVEDSPGGDLISHLMSPINNQHPISREEALDVCYLLVLAGIDPVGSAISGLVALLADDPDERAGIVGDPPQLRRTIEEYLRWGSPVDVITRVTNASSDTNGVDRETPPKVLCSLSLANRDPGVFDGPDRFDPSRTGQAHLAFGYGPHRCVGSHLARLQLRIVLEELNRRLPAYRLDPTAAEVDAATITVYDPLPLAVPTAEEHVVHTTGGMI